VQKTQGVSSISTLMNWPIALGKWDFKLFGQVIVCM
jgi:hypothetical protein